MALNMETSFSATSLRSEPIPLWCCLDTI